MTHMTIFAIWKIPINILTLLIHKNKTCKILRLKNIYEETNDYLIAEEELEHINSDLDHNFPSPTIWANTLD